MRKLIFIGIALITVVIGYFVFKYGMVWYKDYAAISAATKRAWPDKMLLEDEVVIDVPLPMVSRAVPLPPEAKGRVLESIVFTPQQSGSMRITANVVSYASGSVLNLEKGTDGAVAVLKNDSRIDLTDIRLSDSKVMDERAIEMGADGVENGVEYRVHGLFFIHEDKFCQLIYFSPKNDRIGAINWERMRKSVKLKSTSGTVVPGSPKMPAGMKPRSGDNSQ